MKQEKEKVPVLQPGTSSTGAGALQTDQTHYTPSPEEIKQHFEEYLKALPPDVRGKIERFNQAVITEALSADNAAPGLDGLLPELKTLDAATILRTKYAPIPYVIPDYLPAGLTFLIGKPKVGKSWLAMQLALSVMTGGKMLDRNVERGRVLYLALEDNERRLQTRMVKQSWPDIENRVDFMFSDIFRNQITALNAGGGKRLLRYIEKQKYKVVIVDTFSRSIQGDQLDPAEMTEAVGPLQQYALNKGIALIIIDHMPKNAAEIADPIGHIFGSVAKAGVTDTSWAIFKEQGKVGAKLAINGRDVEEHLLQLTFDTQGFYWNCEGNATDVMVTEVRKAVLDALADLGTCQAMAVAEATGQALNHVRSRLNDLYNEGRVLRIQSGRNVFYELVKFGSREAESNESTESSTSE